MEFNQFNRFKEGGIDDSLNFQDLLDKYLRHIKWFVAGAIGFTLVAFLLLQFVSSKYEIAASILINDTEEGSSINELAAFESLGLFGDGNNNLENEIQILKSRKLMTNVVRELKLNTSYFIEGFPLNKESFSNPPVAMFFQSDSSDIDWIFTDFEIEIVSERRFNFINYDGESTSNISFGEFFLADLGNDEDGPVLTSIQIVLNADWDEDLKDSSVLVRVRPVVGVVDNLMRRITIEPINTNISKVISIRLDDPVPQKGIAIINNLIEQFNADGINDKNLIAQSTTEFLDDRIVLISAELAAIEDTAEQFKSMNRMVEAEEGASYFLESSSLNERQLVAANTELELINYMLDELNQRNDYELLPGNIGLTDQGIVALIAEYNDLILQRNRVLKSSSVKNPIIVQIDGQLNDLKANLTSSLNNFKSSSQIQINALNAQGGKISSKIATIPKNERKYKDIVRQQETKNALYLFMLQKREESILSNAVSVNKAKVIDEAFTNWQPVSPKRTLIYLAAFLFGLLVPFLVIYVREFLDTKVHDEKDLSGLGIPFIGEIPKKSSESQNFISVGDDSSTAEAFRYIRTNIGFMLDRGSGGKTIMVTSTQSAEGKSVSAINLAHSLAISGKKTLLLAMDLRVPKISKYLEIPKGKGVANLIKNPNLDFDDLLIRSKQVQGLDILQAGDMPPNPVELLMNDRVDSIFQYARSKYDFIVVDTAPVGMVTDTIQISRYADLTIYVVRADFLDKRMLHVAKRLFEEQKLMNMCLMLNGTDIKKRRYGYGYGYGDKKETKKKWFGFG